MTTLSCSVYKSSGRKSFEGKASGNLSSSSSSGLSISEEQLENTTCWNQPSSDPLWHVDTQSQLIVTKLNDDEIQVCLQAL